MAKLKAPLMSLGASGKLGNALVFFGWKGIDVVREYVIPTNPKTHAQGIQRGYLTACITVIHYMQGIADEPLAAIDTAAYALLGSLEATPRTWFNTIVRQWLKQKVAGKIPIIFRDAELTPAETSITFHISWDKESSNITNATVNWGTSKSALINSQAVTSGDLIAGVPITGMVTKTKYFLQVRTTDPDTFDGGRSGIYYSKTT